MDLEILATIFAFVCDDLIDQALNDISPMIDRGVFSTGKDKSIRSQMGLQSLFMKVYFLPSLIVFPSMILKLSY